MPRSRSARPRPNPVQSTRKTAESRAQREPTPEAESFAEGTAVIDDPTGPMGIRFLIHSRATRAHLEGMVLLLPLESSVVEVTTSASSDVLDKTHWMAVPEGWSASLTARSPMAHLLALLPRADLLERVLGLYSEHIQRSDLERALASPRILRRSTWVHELAHRYLFERAVCLGRDNDATRFLEAELVKEFYFLCHEGQERRHRALLVEGRGALVSRALAFLEEHLFERELLRRLPKACAASASTILRAFQREVGTSPLAYVRARRLDESLLLLKSGRYGVGEVASMVGYANLAAFSQAFRARFQSAPSQVSRDAARARALRGTPSSRARRRRG